MLEGPTAVRPQIIAGVRAPGAP